MKINNWYIHCLSIGTSSWRLMGFVILLHWVKSYFHPHLYEMRSQGPKHYFWQPVLLEKCQKPQIPRVPLYSYYKRYILKCTEITRNWDFFSYLVLLLGDPELKKDHSFLWIESSSSQIISWKQRNAWNLSFLVFFK